MPRTLFNEADILATPTQAQVTSAEAGLGMFAPGLKSASDYEQPADNSHLMLLAEQLKQENDNRIRIQQKAVQDRENFLLAQKKRSELEERARLKAGEKYRKEDLLRNPDGTLAQDSDLEIRLKQGINSGLNLWNKVNDYVPFVDDKTLDINSRMHGTVAGMRHEDLDNKDILGTRGMTKKDLLNEVNSLQDDPNGHGTLYYLRRQDGFDENGQPKYLYKAGFAQLDAADRYRSQANAAGWDIVKEVQSSGSADAEKKIHAMFIGDRALSYGQVKGADGKMHNRDEASGINFGSGYGEIYNKDILGWDKKSTKSDVNKYKIDALKQAVASGMPSDQVKLLRTSLNSITPEQLDQIKLDQNKAKSYAKRDANDAYTYTHPHSDALTAAKAGLTKIGRETADDILDIITPAGLSKDSTLGELLQSDGKGNSQLLDKWKSQEEADKYVGFNRRSENEIANSMKFHYNKGDWTGVLSDVFSGGALNMTAESFGYMAPMLLTAMASGGASAFAAGGIRAQKAAAAIAEGRTMLSEANAVGSAAKAAEATKKITAAEAVVQSELQGVGSKLANAAKFAEKAGFYGQAAVMTNERIDQRIANNGGQPTSIFENAAVMAETLVENYIDRATDLAVVGAAGHKSLQGVYGMLDRVAQQNILTKVAAKAMELTASAGIEGATEYIQNIGQSLSEQYDTKKNGGTIQGILSSKENQEDNLVNFLMGAAGGVHLQSIPTGIDVASKSAYNAWDKVSGNKEKRRLDDNRRTLAAQVGLGTANPYSDPISYTGNDSLSAKADIIDIASHKGNIPMHIAYGAMNEANNAQEEGSMSSRELVMNMNQSLRNAYGIDENGKGKTEEDTAGYEHALYLSAINSLHHVIDFSKDSKDFLKEKGYDASSVSTTQALENVLNSYKEVLPQDTMNQVVLMVSQDVIDNLASTGSKGKVFDNEDATAADAYDGKDKGYVLNTETLEAALNRMNVLMGSLDNGGSKAFKGEDIKASIANMISTLTEEFHAAQSAGGSIEVNPSFFDDVKTGVQVGSEILLHGKRNANGKIQGKGIYQHASLITDDIISADRSETSNKVDRHNLDNYHKFATERVKLNDVSKLKDGQLYSRKDVWQVDADENNAAYGVNYIPQMDLNGKTTRTKLNEAKHFLEATNQIRAALNSSNNLSKEDVSYFNDKLDEIAKAQNNDIAVLTEYLTKIQQGMNKDKIFVDLRKMNQNNDTVKKLMVEAEKTGNYYTFLPRSTVSYNIPDSQIMEEDVVDVSKDKGSESDNVKEEQPSEPEAKTKEESKDEQKQSEERSDEQGKSGESSEEAAKSAEDSKNDESRVEKPKTSDEPKQTSVIKQGESLAEFNARLIEAEEAKLAELEAESISLVEDIAKENGIDFSYDTSKTIAENMRDLRKAITPIINSYKASAKITITETLGKIAKLATLLTAAVKGEGLHGISNNPDIIQAKELHDKRAEIAVSKNPEAKDLSTTKRKIQKLREKIDAATDKASKLRYMKKLADLLNIPSTDMTVKREPTGAAGYASAKANDTHYSPQTSDVDKYWKDMTVEQQAEYVDNIARSVREEPHVEEATNEVAVDIDETGIDSVDEENVVTQEAIDEVTDEKVNIFVGHGEDSAKVQLEENQGKIADKEKEIELAKEKRIKEIIQELWVKDGKEVIIGSTLNEIYGKEAREIFRKETKDC